VEKEKVGVVVSEKVATTVAGATAPVAQVIVVAQAEAAPVAVVEVAVAM